ncbi:hypothetical protein GAY30_31340, partial [Azospirillum brasilense]|nr:hypothetical protein [Azospirillum brasilense]
SFSIPSFLSLPSSSSLFFFFFPFFFFFLFFFFFFFSSFFFFSLPSPSVPYTQHLLRRVRSS